MADEILLLKGSLAPAVDAIARVAMARHHPAMSDGSWTYREWEDATVEKFATMGAAVPEEHRADYLRVQVRLAIQKALRHGRSGLADDKAVVA